MKTMVKVVLIFAIALFFGCNKKSGQGNSQTDHVISSADKVYTCPMHPQIIRNAPGQCPICGMDLVERPEKGHAGSEANLELLLQPTNMYVINNVTTVTPAEMELPVKAFATGTITYDQREVNSVSARVSGRIEKLYVKYQYQPVVKGQRLLDIYSSELETAQSDFLFLLQNDSDNEALINSAVNKLLLFGLTKQQIGELRTSGSAPSKVTIFSPYSGHLHDLMQSSNSMISTQGSMESDRVGIAPAIQELTLKEGMYVSKGQTIFNIYNTEKVWALLEIFPGMQGLIRQGQKISLQIDGLKKSMDASVDFIEPVIRNNARYLSARSYLNNANGAIKVGSIVQASVNETAKGLFVPSSAAISLGIKNIVFVKEGGLFRSRQVVTGVSSAGWTEITSGLNKNDTIAENGGFLMDSESFIRIEK